MQRIKAKHGTKVLCLGCAVLIAALGSGSLHQAAAQVCSRPIDPDPSGSLGRPSTPFPGLDHRFLHSSTSLQGYRSRVKYAGGLLYLPTTTSEFRGFTSAVVVNNPDPTATVFFHIDYYNHLGVLVGTSFPPPIPPEGFYVEAATPLGPPASGVGSAVISVDHGPGIVGSVLMHTECIAGVCDQDLPLSLNGQHPGASSTQQLQTRQDTTSLWFGPLALTNVRPPNQDFFNGEAPFLTVVNPNSQPNRIRVDLIVFDPGTGAVIGPFTWRRITLPPGGTLLEKSGTHLPAGQPPGLWDTFISLYFSGLSLNYDVMIKVVSENNLPILGDGFMTDFFGDGANLIPGKRFRMASTMLANTPTRRLINPDLSYQPAGIVQTLMGIFNAGETIAGPVQIEYFDNNGILIGSDSISSMVPGRPVYIGPGPGFPDSPNYPTISVGFGWARITGCDNDKLVGWAIREILPTGGQHYHKVYGDGLIGNHGLEPGPGFPITNPDADGPVWQRKVSPLVRTTPSIYPFYWPGYTTFVNESVSNIGPYWFRFFDSVGGTCTNTIGQPFIGLPWAFTSTTYEDPLSTCNGNLSGRVDHTTGRIEGIHVLGDPFDEFRIPGFAIRPPREVPVED